MRKVSRRRLLRWFGLLIAGFAVLNLLAYNHAAAMMRFATGGQRTQKPEQLSLAARLRVLLVGVNVPRPGAGGLPAELDPDCQCLNVPGRDSATLATWYVHRGDATPLVILFHGYGREKSSLLREARMLLDLGVSVLLVDFRGSGGSSASYTTIGVREAEDVAAVTAYARGRLAHRDVVLYGQSMGAAAILRAVHGRAVTPDAVIVEAVFDTMLNTVRHRFAAMGVPSFPCAELLVFWGGAQWHFNGFRHNPVEYARSVACPVLFMHGVNDPRATMTEGRRVYDAVAGPKRFVTFDRAGHESYVATHPEKWRRSVGEFLRSVDLKLGSAPQPGP